MCAHARTHTLIHACIHTHTHTHVTHTHTSTHKHTCTHTRTSMYKYTHVHTSYSPTNTQTHTHMHTHMHAQAHTKAQAHSTCIATHFGVCRNSAQAANYFALKITLLHFAVHVYHFIMHNSLTLLVCIQINS